MKKRTVSKWTTALALTVGGAMLATSAVAQSGTAPAKSSADTTKSDAPKADATKSATTGSTAGDTKSGEMKSSAMKSGAARDGAQGTDREQVKAVQQALKDKGHDPGEVDGAMGPKTQAALRDFQQKEGLKATGAADADTMAKLTVSANTPAASPSGTAPSATGAPKDATSPGAKQTK
jgi:peptidoglycan hydrolase-like protein with peptidoglycan-binding domain